jgi:hypothetical protein
MAGDGCTSSILAADEPLAACCLTVTLFCLKSASSMRRTCAGLRDSLDGLRESSRGYHVASIVSRVWHVALLVWLAGTIGGTPVRVSWCVSTAAVRPQFIKCESDSQAAPPSNPSLVSAVTYLPARRLREPMLKEALGGYSRWHVEGTLNGSQLGIYQVAQTPCASAPSRRQKRDRKFKPCASRVQQ